MAEALLPLTTLNVSTHLSKIKALRSKANSYSKMGAPAMPGVPDIKGIVKSNLESTSKKLLSEARTELIVLLIGVMGGTLVNNFSEINKIIRALNRVVDGINRAINSLLPLAEAIFKIIIVLVVAYSICKIIGMIPSPGVGMGAVVVFDFVKTIVAELINIINALLEILWPLAFAIIAIMMLLLSIFSLLQMVMGIIRIFTQKQTDASNGAADAFSKSADDWANSTDVGVGDIDLLPLVECTLPNGNIQQMTPEDCLIAGGTFGDMNLISDYNKCILKLRECENTDSNKEECINIKMECDAICEKLGPVCELQLDENIITSLLNLHSNVTVEQATQRGGKRYGFYGAEQDTTKRRDETVDTEEEEPIEDIEFNPDNVIDGIVDKTPPTEEELISTKSSWWEELGRSEPCYADITIDCSQEHNGYTESLCNGTFTEKDFMIYDGRCPTIINGRT